MSVIFNDSDSAKFLVFAVSLRPSSIDIDTSAGDRIQFLWSVSTGLLVLPLPICFDFNDTESKSGGTCHTIPELGN